MSELLHVSTIQLICRQKPILIGKTEFTLLNEKAPSNKKKLGVVEREGCEEKVF
jgi:hypothetical protein